MSHEDFGLPNPEKAEIPDGDALGASEGAPLPAAKGKKRRKKKGPTTFKKAPQAPKRFKSPYIFFSMAKMEELKKEGTKVTNASTRISEMWRNLPEEERKKWDEVAKKDKIRYMAEKALYTGPWQVPSKRVKKDPSAPKRPMSAFLFFSQGKRQELKEKNPDLKNTEISTRLGDIWKNLSDEERQPFVDREAREREQYKKEMSAWRSERLSEEEAEKKRKEAIVQDFIKSGFVPGSEAPPVPLPVPASGQGTPTPAPAMAPPMPPPMVPGMMPFPPPPMMMPPGMPPPGMPPLGMPPMPMPPLGVPPMPMPPSAEGSQQSTETPQDQQQAGAQNGDQGNQQQSLPFYPGYYYPMYPYPYPMPMPAPLMPPVVYPAAPAQPHQGSAGGVEDAGTSASAQTGESETV